ncbi:hypothetical protein [Photobacterium indicum]|jgi:N-acetylglutamate synthase-like GNAT family acetyltransferase|uniref:N-acetyltransferase domain-containing protein n=1 Tax=Photobacterium indicum TaxID=81447 RepID=A0A2T3L572_9GAMM|nr:hypothetical protein [Photobacterium indicum]PSV44849.1 hypothetical protein C9J47_19400 [Photobacterium indicum]
MEFDWVEWFGYLASLVVLVSLTMTSIVKLRVINFTGCLLFAAFAYFIDSLPTMLMNLGIAGINVYFLYKIYSVKERFKLITASTDSEYFLHFIEMNKKDIELQVSREELRLSNTAFYMLRNNNIAGVLVGSKDENGVLNVLLDYVTEEYRDFKIGTYYFETNPEVIKNRGINTLHVRTSNVEHRSYLETVGFKPSEDDRQLYIKLL